MTDLISNQFDEGASDSDTMERNTDLQFAAMRSVIGELFTALSYVVQDLEGRGPVEECMRRAALILRGTDESTSPDRSYTRGGLAPWQIRKVTSYVDANLGGPIRSEELAALVRLNPCYFSRVFRNSFGDSPCEYVMRRRIERAQGLMLSTGAPLSQVALDCGFSDQSHFSRLFRRVVGEAAATWRRARANPSGHRVEETEPTSVQLALVSRRRAEQRCIPTSPVRARA
jgi:AraC family transcriptional regulator